MQAPDSYQDKHYSGSQSSEKVQGAVPLPWLLRETMPLCSSRQTPPTQLAPQDRPASPAVGVEPPHPHSHLHHLNIQISEIQLGAVGFDEFPAWCNAIAHQNRKDPIGFGSIFNFDPFKGASSWIHRGFPQLSGHHFA